MTDFNQLLQKADSIVDVYHKGQADKAGVDYIVYLRRVSARCNTVKAKIVSLLHDTLEATEVTPDLFLRQGFSQEIVDAV